MRGPIFSIVSLLMVSCLTTPPSRPPPRPLEENPTLDVADVITVRVYDEPQLSGEYRINPEGTILFPLIGRVRIGGLTPSAASELISQQLRKREMLRAPQVTIYVKEFASQKVKVLGEVAKPGTYPFVPNMDIIEAITSAGGFKQYADRDNVNVTRIVDGKRKLYRVHVEAISEGQEETFHVLPGDTINVPERIF